MKSLCSPLCPGVTTGFGAGVRGNNCAEMARLPSVALRDAAGGLRLLHAAHGVRWRWEMLLQSGCCSGNSDERCPAPQTGLGLVVQEARLASCQGAACWRCFLSCSQRSHRITVTEPELIKFLVRAGFQILLVFGT